MALQLRSASLPAPETPPTTDSPPTVPAPTPCLAPSPEAPPQVPYPVSPPSSGPIVPQAARTWLQQRPWLAPVGTGVIGILLGLTIGLAARRRPRVAL